MDLQSLDDADVCRPLRCQTGDAQSLKDAFLKAASEEYANIFTGTYALATAVAAKEYRLFLIIKHAYPGSVPTPEAIGALFRISGSQGRTLLTSVLRKYGEELKGNTRASIKSMLTALSNEDLHQDAYRLSTEANYLVAAMNAELPALSVALHKELHRVSLLPKTASIYEVPEETRNVLLVLHS